MAHLIDFSNNRANMAYIGKKPWHGLGEQLKDGATLDQWRVAAGLDWEIEARSVYFNAYTGNQNAKNIRETITGKIIEGRKALVRSDTQECLSVMSDRYQIVQPATILEFYRDLVDGSQFKLETAGSLKGGAKIWALAKCENPIAFGLDKMDSYLLLSTSCDGTMSTVADFTSVRVVCNNTLTMAVGANGAKAAIKVPHSTKFDPTAVKKQLGLIDDRRESFQEDIAKLIDTAISQKQAVEYFVDIYANKNKDGEVENAKSVKRIVTDLMGLYMKGPGAELSTAKGTAWGLVNAVTHFEDFKARARSNENRFLSAQYGKGAAIKKESFTAALQLAA